MALLLLRGARGARSGSGRGGASGSGGGSRRGSRARHATPPPGYGEMCASPAPPPCPPCVPRPPPPCRVSPSARRTALRVTCCPPPAGCRPPCAPPELACDRTCDNILEKKPPRVTCVPLDVLPAEEQGAPCGLETDRVARRIAAAAVARRTQYELELRAPERAGLGSGQSGELYRLTGERDIAGGTDGHDYTVPCDIPSPRCGPGRTPPAPVAVELPDASPCTVRARPDPCPHRPPVLLTIDRTCDPKLAPESSTPIPCPPCARRDSTASCPPTRPFTPGQQPLPSPQPASNAPCRPPELYAPYPPTGPFTPSPLTLPSPPPASHAPCPPLSAKPCAPGFTKRIMQGLSMVRDVCGGGSSGATNSTGASCPRPTCPLPCNEEGLRARTGNSAWCRHLPPSAPAPETCREQTFAERQRWRSTYTNCDRGPCMPLGSGIRSKCISNANNAKDFGCRKFHTSAIWRAERRMATLNTIKQDAEKLLQMLKERKGLSEAACGRELHSSGGTMQAKGEGGRRLQGHVQLDLQLEGEHCTARTAPATLATFTSPTPAPSASSNAFSTAATALTCPTITIQLTEKHSKISLPQNVPENETKRNSWHSICGNIKNKFTNGNQKRSTSDSCVNINIVLPNIYSPGDSQSSKPVNCVPEAPVCPPPPPICDIKPPGCPKKPTENPTRPPVPPECAPKPPAPLTKPTVPPEYAPNPPASLTKPPVPTKCSPKPPAPPTKNPDHPECALKPSVPPTCAPKPPKKPPACVSNPPTPPAKPPVCVPKSPGTSAKPPACAPSKPTAPSCGSRPRSKEDHRK